MTANHDPHTEPFHAWLERYATGKSTPDHEAPVDPDFASLLAASRLVHGQHQRESAALAAEPPPRWEHVMHAAPSIATSPTGHLGGIPHPPRPATGIADSPIGRFVARWQPALSLAAVVAVLIGLVGGAWYRGVWIDDSSEPTPSFASQVMYDPDDARTYPQVPEQCSTNGPMTDEDELMNRSLSDWPTPSYVPAQAVTEEVGTRVQETWLRYLRCQFGDLSETPPATPVYTVGPVTQTYLSDRARFVNLSAQLPETEQTAIRDYQCGRPVDEIMARFPLPVNQPVEWAMLETTVDNLPRYVASAFAPSDVYLLPDGRYGAITGSVPTSALLDPTTATKNDVLMFVAFAEVDGTLYIDEQFPVFGPPDWMAEVAGCAEQSTPVANRG